MLKRGIGLGLLCVAGHAYSDNILVTTTEDIVKDDKQCSLREAVEYVNQNTPDKGLPEKGYFGCGGKDASAIILLAENATYQLNKQLHLKKSVQIKTTYEASATDSSFGLKNATLKAGNNDRIFLIDDGDIKNLPLNVTLNELNLVGCTQSQCVEQGGLILNKEYLNLQYITFKDGKAAQGGAIYSANASNVKSYSPTLAITNSIFQGNKAQQGGVLYSEFPQFSLGGSVLKNNEVFNPQSALFDVKTTWTEDEAKAINSYPTHLANSTFWENKGHLIRVIDSMLVNNMTMIRNTAGLLLDAPYDKALVANSIVAENGNSDCTTIKFDSQFLQNNAYSKGCTGKDGIELRNIQLIAGTSLEGKCDLNSQGILCPFTTPKDTFIGYFKPRLLPSYTSIHQSPFVNQGPLSGAGLQICQATDQRGMPRPNYEMCDRGAIELVVDKGNTNTIGKDIFYGEKASMSIAEQLADGELLPAEQCKVLFGENPSKQPWKVGCMQIIQTHTVSKGTTTLAQDGTVDYVPNGQWHGTDEFKLQVVTTTTRFNDTRNPYIEIPVRIVQSPPDDFKDKSVKTSGGSTGLGILAGLFGLLGLRQLQGRRKAHEKL